MIVSMPRTKSNEQNLDQKIESALKSENPSTDLENLIKEVESQNDKSEENKITFDDLKKQIEKKMKNLNLDEDKQKEITELLEKKSKEIQAINDETENATENLQQQVTSRAVTAKENPDSGGDGSGTWIPDGPDNSWNWSGTGDSSDSSFFGSIWNGLKNAGGWLKDKWNGLSKESKIVAGGWAAWVWVLWLFWLRNWRKKRKLKKEIKKLKRDIENIDKEITKTDSSDSNKLGNLQKSKEAKESALKDLEKKLGEFEDDSETSETTSPKKKSWFWKWVVWIGATIWWWFLLPQDRKDKIKNWGGGMVDKIKERFSGEKKLDLTEACQHVSDQVTNGLKDENANFTKNFTGIEYDQNKETIKSYNEETKIDVKNLKLDGLDVKFSSNEELIFAANTVNFLKSTLKGKWAVVSWWVCRPFSLWDSNSDIQFTFSDGAKNDILEHSDSNFRTSILGGTGAVAWSILGWYLGKIKGVAAGAVTWWVAWMVAWNKLDDSFLWKFAETISKGENLKRFAKYLNDRKDWNGDSLWAPKQRDTKNVPECSLKAAFIEVGNDIENGLGSEDTVRRDLQLETVDGDPTKYKIKSYGQTAEITLQWCTGGDTIDYTKITKISLEKYNKEDKWDKWDGLDLDFPHNEKGIKEVIRVANLTNYLRSKYHHSCWEQYPFLSGVYGYLWEQNLEVDLPDFWGKEVVKSSTLKEKFPTIYNDVNAFPSAKALASRSTGDAFQEEMNKQAKDDEPTWSQYIKFLHQMTGWGETCYRKEIS